MAALDKFIKILERGFFDNLSLYKRKLDEAIPYKPEFDKIRAS